MITSKYLNRIIAVLVSLAFVFVSLITIFPDNFSSSNNISASQLTYPQELFDYGQIMTIDISVDQETWDNML